MGGNNDPRDQQLGQGKENAPKAGAKIRCLQVQQDRIRQANTGKAIQRTSKVQVPLQEPRTDVAHLYRGSADGGPLNVPEGKHSSKNVSNKTLTRRNGGPLADGAAASLNTQCPSERLRDKCSKRRRMLTDQSILMEVMMEKKPCSKDRCAADLGAPTKV